MPQNMSDHWNISQAELSIDGDLLPSSLLFQPPSSTIVSPTSSPTAVVSLSISTRSSTPPGTIAAAVLGSFALLALICTGVWAFWRWRYRNVIRPTTGARVDLTEPEMQGSATNYAVSRNFWPRRTPQFPFPFESVVPHHHPDAPHSIEPSRTDEEPTSTNSHPRTTRRHTAEAVMMPAAQRPPLDQLELDLADLRGSVIITNDEPKPSRKKRTRSKDKIPKPSRKRATSLSHTGTGSSSSTSRHFRQKSDTSKGRYFHLPPSAQYLADIARFPDKVDPERPWDVRHSLS
ncbi:hypothetical protein BU17DRAFT_97205 [Hysterangium stoloniferum]|nr:hypothetical protein BU17DRAFT_97205 [Hysterangium stoloniferum]